MRVFESFSKALELFLDKLETNKRGKKKLLKTHPKNPHLSQH
jgi:hypothetical protein